VNQTNYLRAYGLEVMNEAGPFKIIGLIKMLESFIWDPGLNSNWLKRIVCLKEEFYAYYVEALAQSVIPSSPSMF